MVDRQFWPRVGYGIGSNTASLHSLEEALHKQYFCLLPIGGFIQLAPIELRMLDEGFSRIDCPHPGVECLVAQLNKIQMHYSCPSSMGVVLQTSMELFILGLGFTASNPFSVPYKKYGLLVTDCWIKSMWEKCEHFNIDIKIRNIDLSPPREGDKWIMPVLAAAGHSPEQLQRLNRVRVHQQVLFLSDVLTASGWLLEDHTTQSRPGMTRWSGLRFPLQSPTQDDFEYWSESIRALHPIRGLGIRIGPYVRASHRIWGWWHDEELDLLFHSNQETQSVDLYKQLDRPNRWKLSEAGLHRPLTGQPCSVKCLPENLRMIVGATALPVQSPPPSSITQALREGGDLWMWENLEITGDEDWLRDAIEAGSCLAVTDGLYMEDVYPDICSAAFIFECQQGRGRIVGSFMEQSADACAYRGELMGLMAIHLVLRAIALVYPDVSGWINLFSDCDGALGWSNTSLLRGFPTNANTPIF